MKTTLLVVALGMISSVHAAQAQINIESDEGNVTIGGDGIRVRSGGQSVNLNPGGITIQQPGQNVRVQSSGRPRSSSTSIKTKKSTAVTNVKTTAVTGLSIEQRVTNLEMQAYGKKTTGIPLIARVEKLETDTLGATGSGTLTVRVTKLASALGVTEGTKQSVIVKKSPPASNTLVDINPGHIDISSSGSGSSVRMNSGGGVGQPGDIVLDTSGFEGTVACNGGNVVLNASSCDIKFTGTINALVLNGSSNEITCDSVRHIQVNGSANDVNWSRSANPSVANAGSANTLKSR